MAARSKDGAPMTTDLTLTPAEARELWPLLVRMASKLDARGVQVEHTPAELRALGKVKAIASLSASLSSMHAAPTGALTPGQCATSLGISSRAVRLAIESGQLDATKVGGRWLIPPEAIEAWRASLKRPGRPRKAA